MRGAWPCVCDTVETCTGTSVSCPADTLASSWLTCRTATSICDALNPFAPAAKVIGSDGKVGDVSSTPFTGYTILQADSLDAATGLAKNSPVLQGGGSVTVYEAFDVM